jgi:hypothetical protein
MTWNIRWDTQPDNITIEQSLAALDGNDIQTPASYYPNTNERPWSTRRFPLAERVLWEGVSVMGKPACNVYLPLLSPTITRELGFPESVVRQVNDIQALLGEEFDHRGVAVSTRLILTFFRCFRIHTSSTQRADGSEDNSSGANDNEFGPSTPFSFLF